jgi:hypothetical protein
VTLPTKYHNTYLPVKYFLNSYRALSDGRFGIEQLDRQIAQGGFMLSNWKIVWVGTCATLRTAVDLFKLDAKSCINFEIRKSMKLEWDQIAEDKIKHSIFWYFLRRERDHIVHEYKWTAYEIWLHPDGKKEAPPLSLLAVKPENAKSLLEMRDGIFRSRDSLELLRESADWIQGRIFNALARAGFDPEEYRRFSDFQPKTTSKSSLLGNVKPHENI